MVIASLLAHLSSPEALSSQAILALLTALGLSSTAGFRAYLPLLALAIGSTINSNILPLQPNFQTLKSPPLIIILGALTILEFVVDKIPVIDHISDAVHTVIRPLSGAIIMAGTQNSVSDLNPWLAAGVGAVLALTFHTVKATTRPVVSATTAGVGNPIVSTIEDILTVVTSVLLIVAPIIGIILLAILVLLMVRLVIGVVHRFRSRKVAATTPVISQGAPARRKNRALQPDYVSGPPAGGSPAAGPSPILQMPSLQAHVPTQPYPPAGGLSGDPPTMPGQMH
jgi:Domain of unknown function (DUF4126)